jgi:hypothetical protein
MFCFRWELLFESLLFVYNLYDIRMLSYSNNLTSFSFIYLYLSLKIYVLLDYSVTENF